MAKRQARMSAGRGTEITQPTGDKAQLLWQQIAPTADAMIAQVNATVALFQQLVVKQMAELDGVDLSEGWALNVQTMRWQQLPKGPTNGAGV